MKASIQTRTGDFFSVAQHWYLTGLHTDIIIRCTNSTTTTTHKPVFKCHKILVRELLEKELRISLKEFDEEADQLIIPDLNHTQFEEIIRLSYGFEKDYKEKPFSHELQLNPLDIKVKIEDEEENEEPATNTEFIPGDPFFSLPGPGPGIGPTGFPGADALSGIPGIPAAFPREAIVLQGNQGNKICPFCQKVFKRQDHLTRHLLQHTGERPHQCTLCQKTYTRKDKLKIHYKKHHPGQVFICFCSKIFFSEREFDEHMKANPQHYRESAGNVEIHEHEEDESEEMVIDEQAHLNQPDKEDDNYLPAKSLAVNQFLKELNNQQQNTSTGFVKKEVEEFDMGYPSTENNHPMKYDEDDKSNHLDIKPRIIMKKKKKKVKKKDNLEDIEDVEDSGEDDAENKKEYPCQYCSNVFTTVRKRKAHYIGDHFEVLKEQGLLFTHNNAVRIKKHGCPMEGCDRSFRHLCEVQDHVNVVHKKEKNYVCELCSKAFPYKKSLRHHMDLKHDVHKPNESILCPKCGDIFNSRAKLSTHIASKHKIRVAKFQCKFCDFKTHAKNVITEHERTHTGEKPEICQWCGKGFNAKKTLKNHERLHTGEKPYQCKLCSSSFAQRTSLNVHMNSHHKFDIPGENNKDEKSYTYKHNNFDTKDQNGDQRPLSTSGGTNSLVDPNDNSLKKEEPSHSTQHSPSFQHNNHHINNQQRSSVFMDYRPTAMPPLEEAPLISIKALNKLRNNETGPLAPPNSQYWMKE